MPGGPHGSIVVTLVDITQSRVVYGVAFHNVRYGWLVVLEPCNTITRQRPEARARLDCTTRKRFTLG